MPARPRRDHADAKVQAAISELTPLLAAFIQNPFDPPAIGNWYLALAKHCPLWALQQRAYRPFARVPVPKQNGNREDLPTNPLRVNHAWHVMRAASEDGTIEGEFLFGGDIKYPGGYPVIDARRSLVAKPPQDRSPELTQRYLVHVYRSALMRRSRDEPLAESLRPTVLRIPDDDEPEAEELGELLYEDDLRVLDELRNLIVSRDLAQGAERHLAQGRLDAHLAELGAPPKKRHGRPSIPGLKKLAPKLATECRVWLSVERANKRRKVSRLARKTLGSWRCSNAPRLWAERLALPFLAGHEIAFLRSTARPQNDLLTAVYLIHFRARDYVKLGTAADYALGKSIPHSLPLGEQNPLAK